MKFINKASAIMLFAASYAYASQLPPIEEDETQFQDAGQINSTNTSTITFGDWSSSTFWKDIIKQINAATEAVAAALAKIDVNCVNDYCTTTGEYCGEWKGATLRRIPFWGAHPGSAINFEWPSQADWASITPDAKLESLELKMGGKTPQTLGSVKVNLSNGQSSPVFEKDGNQHFWAQTTMTFDPDVSISAVNSISDWSYINSLQFYEGNDQVYQYDPAGIGSRHKNNHHAWAMGSKKELADNEELIGVYGNRDYYNSIVAFGFVVKVKPDEDVNFTCPASYQIFIKTEIKGREPIKLEVKLQDTIEDIKAMLQEKGMHPSQTTLIFNSEVLEDDRTLEEYNIKKDSTINLKYKKIAK